METLTKINTKKRKRVDGFKCEVCDKVFSSKGNLKQHMKRHSDEYPFICSYEGCNSKFKIKGDLEGHMISHSTLRPFKCTIDDCASKFKTNKELLNHIRVVHSTVRRFKCNHDGCNLSFKTKPALEQHMISHTTVRPYKCTFVNCGIAFKTNGGLTVHKRIHDDVRRYACAECNYTCNDTTSISRHLAKHRLECSTTIVYRCNFRGCSRAFVDSELFNNHTEQHSIDNPFKCSVSGCKSMFEKQSSLQKHISRVHREKSILCQIDGCTFKCTERNQLIGHMVVHTNHRPYRCTECKYTGKSKSALTSHMKTHGSSRCVDPLLWCPLMWCRRPICSNGAMKVHCNTHQNELSGHIYIFYDPDTDQFKIGMSTNLHFRTGTLKTDHPNIQLVNKYETYSPRTSEYWSHTNLSAHPAITRQYKESGNVSEWFKVADNSYDESVKLICDIVSKTPIDKSLFDS